MGFHTAGCSCRWVFQVSCRGPQPHAHRRLERQPLKSKMHQKSIKNQSQNDVKSIKNPSKLEPKVVQNRSRSGLGTLLDVPGALCSVQICTFLIALLLRCYCGAIPNSERPPFLLPVASKLRKMIPKRLQNGAKMHEKSMPERRRETHRKKHRKNIKKV